MLIATYVVNLDRHVERWAHMRAEAARVGLEVSRISAVDGLRVPAKLRSKFFDENGRNPSSLLPGEIGCYASHLLVCQEIVDRGQPYALVLEDDVVLASDLFETLEAALAKLPNGWDIVRLSSLTSRPVMSVATLGHGRHLVRYSRLPKRTGAQLVSLAGARKILQPGLRVRPIDADLRYGWQFGLDSYGIYPVVVEQTDKFGSAIRGNAKRGALRGRRWQRPTIGSRIHGALHTFKILTAGGAFACLARNLRRFLLGGSSGPPIVINARPVSEAPALTSVLTGAAATPWVEGAAAAKNGTLGNAS
jgi:glycosyl transferase family 25